MIEPPDDSRAVAYPRTNRTKSMKGLVLPGVCSPVKLFHPGHDRLFNPKGLWASLSLLNDSK